MALQWPNKKPEEVFLNGADWSAVLGSATISSVEAEVLTGTVVIDDPVETSFSSAIQHVWVSGGTVGRQVVRLTANLSDGQVFQEDFRFNVEG